MIREVDVRVLSEVVLLTDLLKSTSVILKEEPSSIDAIPASDPVPLHAPIFSRTVFVRTRRLHHECIVGKLEFESSHGV